MGWRRRSWIGPWPGRGPFSDLPPWRRPGWVYGGRGFGRGRGWRNMYWATGVPGWAGYGAYAPGFGYWGNPYNAEVTQQQEADMLKEQAKAMKEEMDSLNERIKELEEIAKKNKE